MKLPKKISELPSVSTIKNADLFAIVQDGVTSNVTFTILEGVISGYTASADTYVTGGVYNSGTTSIDFTGNTDFPPFSVNVSAFFSGETHLWTAGTGTDAAVLAYSNSTGNGILSVAEGTGTTASGDYSHAEGNLTIASGVASHAEGSGTTASGEASHAEGYLTSATTFSAHAEGFQTIASGVTSHAEGGLTIAGGVRSHAEGTLTIALSESSHAEGSETTASGSRSHSQNQGTTASGGYSHAGGFGSEASGDTSFVHSRNSLASGDRSVVLGGQNITGATDDMVYIPDLYIDNCPSYSGDTAAGVGGLTTGMVWQTTAGHSLGVAGILMIKQR